MYLIGNGRLLTRDSGRPYFENGAVAVEGAEVREAGELRELRKAYPKAEFIDAEGGLIMPGLINAHTHFYSYLLRGFSIPGYSPSCFYEALAGRSWKLDRNLSFMDCVSAACAALIESVKCGVTTLFDHHACSAGPAGTLLGIAGAAEEIGVRACLSCEVSSRCGYAACSAGIAENEEFISYCEAAPCDRIRPLFGMHAPFTLSDLDISECVRRCGGRTGFHMHVSEGQDDRYVCMHNYKLSPVKRLSGLGVLGKDTLLAHCVHVDDEEIDLLAQTGTAVVNNPQSNMSNGVGFAPVRKMLEKGVTVGLGTDAYTSDMLESAKAFISSMRLTEGSPAVGVKEASKLLFENNANIASRRFGRELGVIRAGAPADIVIMECSPFTRFTAENADSQILFGLSGHDCRMTMVGGKILMLGRKMLTVDEAKLRERTAADAEALWKRLEEKPDSEYEWSADFTSFQ